jgi:transposase
MPSSRRSPWRRRTQTKQPPGNPVRFRPHTNTLFVSLELSKSRWLLTVSAPASTKLSKHAIAGGDGPALLALLARLRASAERRCGGPVPVTLIQEAGLDGFWIHRLLSQHGIDSHVVDPASIAVNRRQRRIKTDAVDGETLVRTLLAFSRGERQVCSMVRPPSVAAEDRRRLSRERATLLKERTQHTNRIKGLLYGQGVLTYDPLRKDRLARLAGLVTGDGRPLPERLKAEIGREIARLELVCAQLAAVERERDALVAQTAQADPQAPAAMLARLRGIGPELASLIWLEALFRRFDNRRQIAAYAGLAPSPWQSGETARDQGIAKSGNRRLRHAMVELAWFWLRHQPGSALSQWFQQRVGQARGRVRRIAIVALARKLLVALWRYVTQGVIPHGAVFKA